MKKIYFWIAEANIFVLFALWFVIMLNYYEVINLNLSFLPTFDPNLIYDPTQDLISKIPGFATLDDLGKTMIFFGIGGFIIYLATMFGIYFSNKVQAQIMFWVNVSFFSLFAVLVVLGGLFVGLDL